MARAWRTVTLASLLAGMAMSAPGAVTVEAQTAREMRSGVVHACSRYGSGCTSAPIRRGAFGYEVQLPGGTWVSCHLDCENTLRVEVLDFWSHYGRSASAMP